MMWYSAAVFFSHDRNEQASLWEEQVMLIEAESDEQAGYLAEEIARKGEHEFETSNGLVRVHFRRVERVQLIESDTLDNGTILFHRFLRTTEAESLLTPFE
ncbi:MAG: DUF4288 domain-containing protein [Candidatus Obscuribacter sp.]|nr:DUF4288 domain-containing protein [Candidatus Obscuribacter sp.]